MKKKKEKEREKKENISATVQGFFEDESVGLKDDYKPQSPIIYRLEHDFFDDEEYVPKNCFEIKRKERKGEEFWVVLLNKKQLHELDGEKFSEDQKRYMRSVNGFNFLLNYFKSINEKEFVFEDLVSEISKKL